MPAIESGLESSDDLSSSGDSKNGRNLVNNESGLDANDDVYEESAVRSTNKLVFFVSEASQICVGFKRLVGVTLSPLTLAFLLSLVRE